MYQFESNMVSTGRDLVISRSEESGLYACQADSLVLGISQLQASSDHHVYVVSMPTTGWFSPYSFVHLCCIYL